MPWKFGFPLIFNNWIYDLLKRVEANAIHKEAVEKRKRNWAKMESNTKKHLSKQVERTNRWNQIIAF